MTVLEASMPPKHVKASRSDDDVKAHSPDQPRRTYCVSTVCTNASGLQASALVQDGDPRVLVLKRGPVSITILRQRVPSRRSDLQAIFSSPPADIFSRRPAAGQPLNPSRLPRP